jgi:prostaglandin-H2 D-isomerase / glutathione transferase
MPMGQMPVLEVDGKIMHQSISICRYLAKKVGLAGSNDLESFDIDSAVDTCNDFRASKFLKNLCLLHFKLFLNTLEHATWAYEENAELKAKKREEFTKDILPFYLKSLEAIAKENNGHLALKKLTWADLWFTGVLDYLKKMNERDILEGYPNLQKVVDNTLAIESIKKWVEIRPITSG